jgi:hypothetical protein
MGGIVTRIMRDSTTAADIPIPGCQLVAGYSNGQFVWTPEDWARFGTMPKVRIDVDGSNPSGASVLDVERGDVTVAGAVSWVQRRRHLFPGTAPTIYCNRSTSVLVQAAMHDHGIMLSTMYTLWIATLDGTDTLPDMRGVVAIQYAGEAQTGGHYDESIVFHDTWHPANPPAPPWQRQALLQAQRVTQAATELAKLIGEHQ